MQHPDDTAEQELNKVCEELNTAILTSRAFRIQIDSLSRGFEYWSSFRTSISFTLACDLALSFEQSMTTHYWFTFDYILSLSDYSY